MPKAIRRKVATRTQSVLKKVSGESKTNSPKAVAKNRATYGKADTQRYTTSILTNKPRRGGAKIKR